MAAGEFDAGAFDQAKFSERTREIKAPQMSGWFKNGEPVFVVRGLTFDELIRCESIALESRIEAATALAQLAIGEGGANSVQDIQEALGWGNATQPATRVALEKVMVGMVAPKLTRARIGKIAKAYPATFAKLRQVVMELTEEGQCVEKKSLPSGPIPESEPA